MAAQLVAQETILVGKATTIEAPSPSEAFGVVFEDDGDTGYFYGLDFGRDENPIVDALHIYNVHTVTDRKKPSTVQIVWSQDGLKAALLINDQPHAVFDFAAHRGYCRTGFPPADKNWSDHTHDWSDEAMALIQ